MSKIRSYFRKHDVYELALFLYYVIWKPLPLVFDFERLISSKFWFMTRKIFPIFVSVLWVSCNWKSTTVQRTRLVPKWNWCWQPKAKFLDEIQTEIFRVFLLAIHSLLYSSALRFLFLQTHTISYVFLQTHATSYVFLHKVTVHCKGERRTTW